MLKVGSILFGLACILGRKIWLFSCADPNPNCRRLPVSRTTCQVLSVQFFKDIDLVGTDVGAARQAVTAIKRWRNQTCTTVIILQHYDQCVEFCVQQQYYTYGIILLQVYCLLW